MQPRMGRPQKQACTLDDHRCDTICSPQFPGINEVTHAKWRHGICVLHKAKHKEANVLWLERMSGNACALAISPRHFKLTVGRGMHLMIGQCSKGV